MEINKILQIFLKSIKNITLFILNWLTPYFISEHILNLKRFRKWIGGNWFYNRYIFDLGRGMVCMWEQNDCDTNRGFTLNKESY